MLPQPGACVESKIGSETSLFLLILSYYCFFFFYWFVVCMKTSLTKSRKNGCTRYCPRWDVSGGIWNFVWGKYTKISRRDIVEYFISRISADVRGWSFLLQWNYTFFTIYWSDRVFAYVYARVLKSQFFRERDIFSFWPKRITPDMEGYTFLGKYWKWNAIGDSK